MDVWVIEGGEYEDRFICAVADSVETAAKFMQDRYGEPYIVKWDEPKCENDDRYTLTGHFTGVPGYCGTGPITYEFTRYEVARK